MSDQSVSGQARRAAGYATLALNLERERNSLQREVAELKAQNAELYQRNIAVRNAHTEADRNLRVERAAKEAAEQRCAELAKDGWQPIETAPRVAGKYILLHGNGDAIQDCSYVGCWQSTVSDWVLFASRNFIRPTHWMPLPDAPKDGAL